MDKSPVHAQGPALSRIVAGAWRWNSPNVAELIATSLDVGITSFDHADIYGDYENEKIFGEALKKVSVSRDQIQLISKCGIRLMSSKQPSTKVKHYDTSKDHILQSVDQSLKNLGTHYLDLLLIHRPDPLLDPEEVAEAFGLLRQNGKVLHFGVSNFTATQFEMLQSYLTFPLVTNQIEISLHKREALFDGTLDCLLKHRVSPLAWSPLGGGKLFQTSAGIRDIKQASETQLALAWLLHHPALIYPVIGTTQPDRIVESAKAVELTLSRQEWFQMLKAVSGVDVP